jgi:ribulose-phosphate 3-epimerase
MEIYPSLISSNLLELGKTITRLDQQCDGYHIDIMDYRFVPNMTWGPAFVEAFVHATSKRLHIHLMVEDPFIWVDRLALRKEDSVIFHYEAFSGEQQERAGKIIALCKLITTKGYRKGLAINPETEVELIIPLLEHVDTVLVMSVNPGFSGQALIPAILDKIPRLVAAKKLQKARFLIGMDGGVNLSNIATIAAAGVDYVGVASAIFSSKDEVQALQALYHVASSVHFKLQL